MDRIEFSNSIDNISSEDIIKSFDNIMTLYNIVGSYDNIKISKKPGELASFNITFEDEESVKNIIAICDGMKIDIYNHSVTIKCEHEKSNFLHIIFY